MPARDSCSLARHRLCLNSGMIPTGDCRCPGPERCGHGQPAGRARAGPRWRIEDGTKPYYVVTRGGELAVLDNTRAATDPTVRGDLGVDLDLFLAGRLDVSVTAGEEMNLLSLDAVGVLALRDLVGMVDGALIAPQVVGRVDLLMPGQGCRDRRDRGHRPSC